MPANNDSFFAEVTKGTPGPHPSHRIVDVSDVSTTRDMLCQDCDGADDELQQPCPTPAPDPYVMHSTVLCEALRAVGTPLAMAAAIRIEALKETFDVVTENGDRTTMAVEPFVTEAEKLIFRCVHELGTIALIALEKLPDGEERYELARQYDRALDLQHPVLRHFERIKAIGRAARDRVIERVNLRPPAIAVKG